MPNDHVPCPPDTERNDEVLYIRIPLSLREQVDAHREKLQRVSPHGVDVSRAAAIRNLLELALKAAA